MTETTQTQTMPSRGGGRQSSPEFRVAMDAWRRLRQDLFHDAFAYLPMPPMKMDGPFTSRFSGRLRAYVAWAPHAAVVVAGLFSMAIAASGNDGGGLGAMVAAVLAVLPILLTMIRPVAAFWASMIAAPLTAVGSGQWDDWPWTAGSFAAHLVVMTVVALRTRPRIAAWMWILTAAYGAFMETTLGGGHYAVNNTVPLLFVSAMSMLAASALTIRRTAQREVTAQQTVTEHERSRRTLLEERTTIARELHDVVAHHMSVVAIQAEAAPYRVENPPPELEQAFATIRENAVAALTELRRVLGVVRAEDYEAPDAPQPTLADLDHLLANVREAGLTVDKVVTGAVRELPQGVELSAYRIVQEALSNTLRHAPGATARVEIGYVLGGLGLRVVNGPSPEVTLVKSTHGTGHGLTGMRERVTMLNGEMTTGETEDGGYEVTVFLPVAGVSEADA
ncbi:MULTISPECIES: sensor histidine kinase [Streptomyces]|uniref:histidine kinase n=1 Tax=Streptomyces caniscabiei TaxID=2746961 RepID=A0ABU4MIU5_9ACTN|nr:MULTISPECIES: histidine kinase [Streptomyces]MBE4735205.1 two-component sensor histidine kinase [Streptomyces caniscabiei]MBE4754339.1 two-component sensor histidine kinase [Streptomyces caniscabiei]MBE4767931.1 two-component sensor histidine kinase [Streptomyces caniscabiei]MBE4784387.1 two-component sensor histidine kinase [Streptomyces caniscabiei]MBE4791114.1 two-component sensor histidine kinase [Streptomyces caniscabiei]